MRRSSWVVLVSMAVSSASPAWSQPEPDSLFVAAASSPAAAADLSATTAVPWNPSAPIESRRGWERAVLLPGRIVSMPLSWLGAGMRSGLLWAEERDLFPTKPLSVESGPKKSKLFGLGLPKAGERAGLGASIVLKTPGMNDRRPLASARYSTTVRHFDNSQLQLAKGPFDLQYGYDWRPQIVFFGLGNGTIEADKSGYAWQDEYARAAITLTSPRDTVGKVPHAVFRTWAGSRSRVMRHTRELDVPTLETMFPGIGEATLNQRVDHFVYGASGYIDWRAGRPHWSRGGKLRLDAERYAAPVEAIALHSAQARGAEWTRVVAEAEAGFSFYRDPRTLRFRARVQDQTIGANRDRMLIPDYSRLGGSNGLAAFEPGRYHDEDLLLTRVTYIWPLLRLFELDAHSEWGAVYRDVWRDASIRTMANSYGIALRGRSDTGTYGSIGVDLCNEGFRVGFKVGALE